MVQRRHTILLLIAAILHPVSLYLGREVCLSKRLLVSHLV